MAVRGGKNPAAQGEPRIPRVPASRARCEVVIGSLRLHISGDFQPLSADCGFRHGFLGGAINTRGYQLSAPHTIWPSHSLGGKP